MTTKYCDHGLYGAYTSTPTWGVAQDGDGSAKTAATPATCEVVFTGVPEIGSIAVLGVTLSPSWVTSADVCANNLATAINASTGTATSPDGITSKSQVRNHLFARGPADGAPTGTCQIMMRQGTAEVNGQIAVTHTLDSVSSPGTINFAGGVGGAWGWVNNMSVGMWPSGYGGSSYGIWTGNRTFCGSLDPGDKILVRSGKYLEGASNTNMVVYFRAMGNRLSPVEFIVDDGTIWTEDTGEPVLEIAVNATAGYSLTLQGVPGSTYAILRATRYPSGNSSLRFATKLGSTNASIAIALNGVFTYNIDVIARGSTTGAGEPAGSAKPYFTRSANLSSYNYSKQTHYGIKLRWPGQSTAFLSPVTYAFSLSLIGGEIEAYDSTAPVGGMFNVANYTAQCAVTLDGVKFTGFVPGSNLIGGGSSVNTNGQMLVIQNCDLGGVTSFGPYHLGCDSTDAMMGIRGMYMSSQYGDRPFAFDRPGIGFAEWHPARGLPTLNATLLDGVTKWSIRAIPTTLGYINYFAPHTLPKISKRTPLATDLAEGPRTLTFNFLIDSTLVAWTKKSVSLMVFYEKASGGIGVLESYDPDGAPFDVSTAAWSSTTWNGQTWLKRSISVVTPDDVAEDTEIIIEPRINDIVGNTTQAVIYCPDILIS